MSTLRPVLVAIAGLAVLGAAPAGAAPARTGTAAVGSPYAWDGVPISGAGTDPAAVCALPGACDDTLVTVAAGDVTVTVAEPGGGAVDLDLYVYASDATGKIGDLVASDADGDATETATFLAPAGGPYLVRVIAATALQGTYKGTATVKASTSVPAPGAGGAIAPSTGPNAPGAPKPPAQKVVLEDPDPTESAGGGGGSTMINRAPGAKVTRTTSRTLAGTAADPDGTVGRVQVALVRLGSGSRRCTQLLATTPSFTTLKSCTAPTRYLTASGRLKWSLTLRRALPKGRYVVYVRATDRKGLRQAAPTKRAFTVR